VGAREEASAPAPHGGGEHGGQCSSTWQQLWVVSRRGTQRFALLQSEMRPPGLQPASPPLPTAGRSRTAPTVRPGGQGVDGGGGGLPPAPCCWQLRAGASAAPTPARGTGLSLPRQCQGAGRTSGCIMDPPMPLQGLQPAPPPPPWAPRNPRRASLAPGEAAGQWGDAGGQKIARCR